MKPKTVIVLLFLVSTLAACRDGGYSEKQMMMFDRIRQAPDGSLLVGLHKTVYIVKKDQVLYFTRGGNKIDPAFMKAITGNITDIIGPNTKCYEEFIRKIGGKLPVSARSDPESFRLECAEA